MHHRTLVRAASWVFVLGLETYAPLALARDEPNPPAPTPAAPAEPNVPLASASSEPPPPPAAPAGPAAPPAPREPQASSPPSAAELPPSDAPPPVKPPAIPWAMRGGFALDTATTSTTDGELTTLAARAIVSMPVARHLHVDARFPVGVSMASSTRASVGNPTLSVRGIVDLGADTWLAVSGGIGLPLLSGEAQRANGAVPMIAAAFWDLHDYMPSLLPIELRLGLEKRIDWLSLRGEVAPVLMMPVGRSDDVELAVLHAAELEAGGAVSAGLRFQGVALPTTKDLAFPSPAEGVPYQAALEPFVVLRHHGYFARSGLVLPLDEPLGPPLTTSYGFRFAFGVRFE